MEIFKQCNDQLTDTYAMSLLRKLAYSLVL